MAIEYVGGVASGRAGSTSTTTQSLTSLTGGLAAQPAENDVVVVTVVVGSQGRNPDCAISGWSTVGTQLNVAAVTYDTSLQTSYKVMTSSPDTSITIPSTGNIADGQSWAVQVFRGVDTATPMDTAAVGATGSGVDTRFDAAAITPVTPGAWILICGGGATNVGTTAYIAPTGFTNDGLYANGADTNDGMVGAGYYTGWSSGSYDPGAVGGGHVSGDDSWAVWTIALRPYVRPSARLTLLGVS